jgi:hypothetical protein
MNNMKKKNMKQKLIVVGSVGAGVLLVLALFLAIVSAQTIKITEVKDSSVSKIKNEKTNHQVLSKLMNNKRDVFKNLWY